MKSELLAAIMRAERPVKVALCGATLTAFAGWAVAAAFSGYITVLRVDTIAAQLEAKTATASIDFYKQAAAKAYTQMLMAKGRAGDSAALIPAGTRVECNMTYSQIAGKPVGKCEGPLFLPPRSFVN